ncbi:WD40 repeat domain-containing protein [Bradyrhizobium genosp. A]|uniref:WD40 repeat domain-containing protein n=1 Tax=Bradyrhizobium genosp. A TaxID=83626 RepID=UPI003CEB84EC
MIAPALNAFGQELDSTRGHAMRLESSRVLPTVGYATGVVWSADSSRLAAISNFGQKVTVWSADGTRLAEMNRRRTYVDNSIAFLSNEMVITAASQTEDESLAFSLWSVSKAGIVRNVAGPAPGKPPPYNSAEIFEVAPDGKIVAAIASTGNERVTVYSTQDWNVLASIPVSAPGELAIASALAFSPDSNILAVGVGTGGKVSGKVELFDLNQLNRPPVEIPVYTGGRTIGVGCLSFSLDGRFLATGAGAPASQGPAVPAIQIWRLADRSQVASFSSVEELSPVRQLGWRSDGRFLVVAARDHAVRVFAQEVPEQPIATSSRYRSVSSVNFSPDGRLIAATTDTAITIFALVP